eukprot:661742-Pleurochrysis_carterae.AAC.1
MKSQVNRSQQACADRPTGRLSSSQVFLILAKRLVKFALNPMNLGHGSRAESKDETLHGFDLVLDGLNLDVFKGDQDGSRPLCELRVIIQVDGIFNHGILH